MPIPARGRLPRDSRLWLPTEEPQPPRRSNRLRRRAGPLAARLRRGVRRVFRYAPAGQRIAGSLYRPCRRRAGLRGLVRVLWHGPAPALTPGRRRLGLVWSRSDPAPRARFNATSSFGASPVPDRYDGLTRFGRSSELYRI